MIREMGNVELFELCETIPKVQCSECLLCWNQGVIYCTCGHLLVKSESSQKNFNQWRLGALSIPHYVIKKGRPHGARHRKTEEQKEHFVPTTRERDVSKRSMKEFTIVSNEIQYILIRKCTAMDKLAQEDHSYRLSYEEDERHQKHWYLTLNQSGRARMHR